MKLIWFKAKNDGRTWETEFGCLWPFFVILAGVIALVWWLV